MDCWRVGVGAGVILMDLSKALDSLNHELLHMV